MGKADLASAPNWPRAHRPAHAIVFSWAIQFVRTGTQLAASQQISPRAKVAAKSCSLRVLTAEHSEGTANSALSSAHRAALCDQSAVAARRALSTCAVPAIFIKAAS